MLSPEGPSKWVLHRMPPFYRNSPAITTVSCSEKSCCFSPEGLDFSGFSAAFVSPPRTFAVIFRHTSPTFVRHSQTRFSSFCPKLYYFSLQSALPPALFAQKRPCGAAAGPLFLIFARTFTVPPMPARRRNSSRRSRRPWSRGPADTPPRPPAARGWPSRSGGTGRKRCR